VAHVPLAALAERLLATGRFLSGNFGQISKKKIEQFLAQLPPAQNFTDNSTEIDFEFDFEAQGELFVTLVPHRTEKRAATVRGVISGADNTEERIRAAIMRKKKQVKKTGTPVILAVRTDTFGDMKTMIAHCSD